jgi:hypothetical protein
MRSRVLSALLVLGFVAAAQPAQAQGRMWCGEITSNTVWSELSDPHTLTCDVHVTNSVLTIEAGSIVFFEEGVNLVIGNGASLVAVGVENRRIRFRAVPDDVEAGFWGQIRFEPGALPSQIEFADIQDGGKDGEPMVLSHGAVVKLGSQPAQARNVRFLNGAGAPLAMSANEIGPSLEEAGQFTAGRACEQVKFETSNARNGVEVLAPDEPDIREPATWHDFCVPYFVNDDLSVGGPDAPNFILDAATLRFGADGSLTGGVDAENPGSIDTTAGVLLAGQEEVPGAWRGVDLTEFGGPHSFTNVVVRHGGRDGRPMVRVRSLDSIAFDASFQRALGYPLEVRVGGMQSFLDGIAVDSATAFTDNGVQKVRVVVDRVPAIQATTTLLGIGVPVEFSDDVVVAGPGNGPFFRLRSGANVHFPEGKSLIIGHADHGAGSLILDGHIGGPVVVAGAEDRPGSWKGIEISERADTISIGGARIEGGGGDGAAMIRWLGGRGAITSTHLTGAAGYPLEVPGGQLDRVLARPVLEACPTPCTNRIEGNGVDRYLAVGDVVPDRGLLHWVDPGAPVEMRGSIRVEASGFTRLDMGDGLELLFAPGEGIFGGADAARRVDLRFPDEDPERPVVLGPADPAAGWAGIVLKSSSLMVGTDVVVEGGPAGEPTIRLENASATLARAVLRNAPWEALSVEGPSARAEISLSQIRDNRVGIVARDRAMLRLVESTVQGNTEAGVVNEHRAFCIDAIRVFWGRPGGPEDPSDAEDNCIAASNLSPGADMVSDWVDWWPYATSADGYPRAQGMGPNPRFVYLPAAKKGN